MSYSISLSNIEALIMNNKSSDAEKLLNKITERSAQWYYLTSIIFKNKAWFDSSIENLKMACQLEPTNLKYQEELFHFLGRHRRYSDDYYRHGYRRRRGCSCCCCDDCCCDCDISCCDLICLDSCCECMGGDLIECI